MRFAEVGQQLKAYRIGSGLRADEIAARLGISRAALYRYEKGEVVKLDTVARTAELLKVSLMSLLSIGIEYYGRPIGYFERVREIEESVDQVIQVLGPVSYLTTSDAFDRAVADGLSEAADQAGTGRMASHVIADQLLCILASRKKTYTQRKPGIIALLPASSIRAFLDQGLLGGLRLSTPVRRQCRAVAAHEVERIAVIMETEPMGLQFGLLDGPNPSASFEILRSRERAMLAVNPFRADGAPDAQTGVAMITGADEAVTAHQRVAEAMWRDAVKGRAAAAALRTMMAARRRDCPIS